MPALRAVNPPPDESGAAEILIWNDAVHERVESAHLYFWRLSFGFDYDRDSIFEHLAQFYRKANINSYVAYETLGDYDVLIRMWVPRTYIAEEIENALRDALREDSL